MNIYINGKLNSSNRLDIENQFEINIDLKDVKEEYLLTVETDYNFNNKKLGISEDIRNLLFILNEIR